MQTVQNQPLRHDNRTVNGLPLAAAERLTRLEIIAETLQQTAQYSRGRVADIEKALNYNPGGNREALALERKELLASREEQSKRARDAASLLGQIRQWVQHLIARPRPLEMAPQSDAQLLKGETLVKAIARVRAEIVAVKKAQYQTGLAPLPREDLKARAKTLVAQMGAQLTPHIALDKFGAFNVGFSLSDAMGGLTPNHVLAMMSWLAPKEVTARLCDLIETMPMPDAPALSASAKEARIKELTGNLDQLERLEEAFVRSAHEEGVTGVVRRHDANPMAVLGVRFAQPKPIKAAPKANGAKKPKTKPKIERVRLLPQYLEETDDDGPRAPIRN